jgi:adenine-specific DNA-methyltransferase
MESTALYHAIEQHLNSANLRSNLTALFLTVLRWGQPTGRPFSVTIPAPHSLALTIHPVAQLSGLPVFRADWPADRLPTVTERRAVYRKLAATHVEHLLCYVTAHGKQAAFVWACRAGNHGGTGPTKTELRTLSYEVGSPARTTIERLAYLAFSLDELGPTGHPPLPRVLDKLDTAFDVQAVTDQFFADYTHVFAALQTILRHQTGDRRWAHDYALQLLNRLLFLYFIQRKGWLSGNTSFLRSFWRAYRMSRQPPDTFFSHWLSVLFFEAFTGRWQNRAEYRQRFPEPIYQALATAPWLNGGLFTRNRLDTQHTVTVPDEFFASLFDTFKGRTPGFLDHYNFTITETTPFEIEVAVDPEMIGKVYEQLVNITFEGIREEDLRGRAGIFYTPRVEIDLMCRLALVDYLANHLGQD